MTGLEAYLQQQQASQQQSVGNLQQAQIVQGMQANAQKQQRDQAYREELQGLGTNATPEQLSGVAAKYGGPDVLLKTMENAQLAKDRMAAQKDALQANLAQKKELADARLEQQTQYAGMMHEYRLAQVKTADERAAEVARHNKQIELFTQQNAATNAELKKMGLQAQADKAAAADESRLQKQTQQLGTALERANLPEAHAVLGAVEAALQKTPALSEYLSGPKSLLPDATVPNDIAAGRQAFSKLFNITLKNRSGAAVTNQELERLKNEFATGVWKTPQQLKNGVEQARNIISQHYRGIASGFGPDAMSAYNDNLRQFGGTPLLESGESPQAAPSSATPKISSDAEYTALPSGATYIAPDGSTRKKK